MSHSTQDGPPPFHPTKNDLVPQVNSAKAEKPCSRSRVVNFSPPECYSMCEVNFYHTWESWWCPHCREVKCFAEQCVQCSSEKATTYWDLRGESNKHQPAPEQKGHREVCKNSNIQMQTTNTETEMNPRVVGTATEMAKVTQSSGLSWGWPWEPRRYLSNTTCLAALCKCFWKRPIDSNAVRFRKHWTKLRKKRTDSETLEKPMLKGWRKWEASSPQSPILGWGPLRRTLMLVQTMNSFGRLCS